MSTWPHEPGWSRESYWLGVATTFAFMQADIDTEANATAGGSPTLKARLPYVENPEPGDLDGFGAAVALLNEDCQILYWRLVRTNSYGEHYVEFGSTEGWQGIPNDWVDGE